MGPCVPALHYEYTVLHCLPSFHFLGWQLRELARGTLAPCTFSHNRLCMQGPAWSVLERATACKHNEFLGTAMSQRSVLHPRLSTVPSCD